jgi:DNA-binding response OmpR family regulator
MRPSATSLAQLPQSGARVLIIEDDCENREALSSFLAAGGYVVVDAGSGAEGLRLFQQSRCDLVLTDLGICDLSGWSVAAAIKAVAPETPIALLTGWRLAMGVEELRQRGVDMVISKPIEPRRFLAQVAELKGRSPSGGDS